MLSPASPRWAGQRQVPLDIAYLAGPYRYPRLLEFVMMTVSEGRYMLLLLPLGAIDYR